MASSFDLDAYREAHRPWEFLAGGFTFVSRLPSAEQVRQFAAAELVDPARALAALLRVAFPWRPSYWWRGDPVHLILALEPSARKDVLDSFFEWVRATYLIPHPAAKIPGTRSPARTAART